MASDKSKKNIGEDEDLDGDVDLDDDMDLDEDIGDDDDDDLEAPVLDDSFDDPDDDENDDDESSPKPLRPSPPPKRSTLRGTQIVGGVPRAKLDDPKVAAEVWGKLRDGVKGIDPIPYAVTTVFNPDDIIEHKKFGVGFVIAVPGGKKVEVLFSDQVRRLVQGR